MWKLTKKTKQQQQQHRAKELITDKAVQLIFSCKGNVNNQTWPKYIIYK